MDAGPTKVPAVSGVSLQKGTEKFPTPDLYPNSQHSKNLTNQGVIDSRFLFHLRKGQGIPPYGNSAKKLDSQSLRELEFLSKETDPQLYYEGLLGFAQRQQASGREDVAAEVYQLLIAPLPGPLPQGERELADASLLKKANPKNPSPLVGEGGRRPGEGEMVHWSIPASIQNRARRELDALMGRGALGPRLEFLSSNFVDGATDPALLFAFGSAGAVFKFTRFLTLRGLAGSSLPHFIKTGFGARATASLVGFSFEAPLFPIAGKLGSEILGREVDWSWKTTKHEIYSSILVLGGLKLVGWGVGTGFNKLHGVDPITGQAKRLATLSTVSRPLMPQVGMLGGIMAGHKAEEWAGLREPMDGATTLTDSLATLFQFGIAGRINQRIMPKLHALERHWDRETYRLAQRENHRIPPLPVPLPQGERGLRTQGLFKNFSFLPGFRTPSPLAGEGWGEGEYPLGLQPAGTGGPRKGSSIDTWFPQTQKKPTGMEMASAEDPRGGRPPRRPRRDTTITTSLGKAMEESLAKKINSLEELPEIERALLPQTRRQLPTNPQWGTLLKKFGGNLKKLDQVIGDSAIPGAAPFVGRVIARRLFKNQKTPPPLHEHPVARIVAASLAAHYESLGDLIGNRIYRDLNTVYRLLQNPKQEELLRAEQIILQNLELDPYNPWLLRTGLWVSKALGEFATQKPTYYEELIETMERLPEKWRANKLIRPIEKKFVRKYSKKLLETSWKVSKYVYMVTSVLSPIGIFLTGLFPTPGNLLRFFLYGKRLLKGAKDTPSALEARKKKAIFEIHLFYGDYKTAIYLAEPQSKLPTLWEFLTRQRMGKLLEKKIQLEPVPQLNPHTVAQTETLQELETKLNASGILNLEGIEGSSKTTLAAQLAHRYLESPERPVFWYTLREDKTPSLRRLLEHMAHFLEIHNPDTEKGLLAKVQEQKTISDKVQMVRTGLHRTPSLLFFDNFHGVLEDPPSMEVFSDLFKPGLLDTKVITITQRDSQWLQKIGAQSWQRGGLNRVEARELFRNLGVLDKLTPEQMEEVHRLTGNLPQGLVLLGRFISKTDPAEIPLLLGYLKDKNGKWEVAKSLFHRTYDQLNENQQSLLQFLSIFRDPVLKEAIFFIGEKENNGMQSNLAPLKEAFLIEEKQEGVLELHRTYKILLSPYLKSAKELHRRAAEFFRAQAEYPSDYLEAAYHYFKAEEYDRSVWMISRRSTSLLRSGYLSRLESLLIQFGPNIRLKADDRAEINLAKGSLAFFQGDLFQSMEFFRKGLKSKRRLGDQEGVALFYYKLGKVHDAQGQWKKAISYYDKSLQVRKGIRDYHGMFHTLMKMGQVYQSQLEFGRAYQSYRKSLALQEVLGDPFETANVFFHLGVLERDRGNPLKAEEYLKQSLEIYQRLEVREAVQVQRILQDLRRGP